MLRKPFSLKAILLGLTGGLTVALVAYPNDYMARSNLFIGSSLPFGVFCVLFLINLLYRPLSRRLPGFCRFGNGELAVAFVIVLASCSIPTSGLMRYFPQVITCPYDLYSTRQNWQTYHVLKYAPDALVPEGWYVEGDDPEADAAMTAAERQARTQRAEKVNKGFRNGLVHGRQYIYYWSTREKAEVIPLDSWVRPMLFWGPMILLFLVFITTMMVIVHPQWSQHELLPYPLAEFTDEMLHRQDGRAYPRMWYANKFWVAFFLVAAIHTIRWIYVWYPDRMINVKLEWNIAPEIAARFPNYYYHGMGAWSVFRNKLYISVIAFAYFIPTDASFSLGISMFVLSLFSALMWSMGVNFTHYHLNSALTGSYFAMFLIIIYLGRNYYFRVFRCALLPRTDREGVEADVVWAARTFLSAFAGMVVLGCVAGLNIFFSLFFFLSLGVLYLVLARVSAESGSPLVQAGWKPADFFFKLFGATAIGPYSVATLGLLTTALASDPRESLAAFLTNGFKVAERERLRPRQLGRVVLLVLIPCVVVAFLTVLWVNYNGRGTDHYALTWPPRRTFDRVASAVAEIDREPGLLAKVSELEKREGWFSVDALSFRMTNWSMKPGVLPWLLFGAGAIIVCYALRLRFTWWMIHPVLFLGWGVAFTHWFSVSFLVGFGIKSLIVRYGGGKTYYNFKPFFMGAIMGECVIAAFIMVFNIWYYFHFGGITPKRYLIFPA
ncbi:MAG: hypothetical protein GXP31_07115 [Kiritimatiellaeota bacterium]|nr:hypothetical protein [Kiritimatiellota bacterium]